MESIASILEFWFGNSLDDNSVAKEKSALWWAKDLATDQHMRERFASLLPQAEHGNLAAWLSSAEGRLAAILVCDQFPRNIHRGTAQSFAYDALAREWCKAGLAAGDDKKLRPIQRVFFYLPLEHSESLADQTLSVSLFDVLASEMSDVKTFAGFRDFAEHHRVIIARFGRFPHRNVMLGRTSTAEELVFLQGPGSSF